MEIKPVIRQSVQATKPLKDVRCLATVKQTNDTLRIIKCQAPIAQQRALAVDKLSEEKGGGHLHYTLAHAVATKTT